MAPQLSYGRHRGPAVGWARPAAVCMLLYPRAGTWHLPLTLRPGHMVAHADQISLPGGVIEEDEDSREAALRELNEELGIPPADVTLLGRLSDLYIFNSNYLVTPWLAAVDARPAWKISADEVAELLEVPLPHLVDPATAARHLIRRGLLHFEAPHFAFDGHRIWGATAIMLGELVALISEITAGQPM